MALYQVPPDTKEKEKIIGGVLDWTQFFWLLAGFVLGLILAFIAYSITSNIPVAVIFALVGIGSTIPFALIRKLEMPLFTYLSRKRALKKKTKQLINIRKGV